MKTIVWLREDLRLYDNPALHYAAAQGQILPVFIYPENLGGASYWWLHHSLLSLSKSFARYGAEVILRTGKPGEILVELAHEVRAEQLVWNRVYSPQGVALGVEVKKILGDRGIAFKSFNAQLLIEPGKVLTKQGTPFKVFTPFWRNCVSNLDPSPILPEAALSMVSDVPESQALEDWGLLPSRPDWSTGMAQRWQPGEEGAQKRWQLFLEGSISHYKDGRDIPGEENTSMLSPHLAFGEISPKQLWFDMHDAIAAREIDAANGNKFLSELGWREFSRYLLVHFPQLVASPFNQRFADFPWQSSNTLLKAWQKGETGYPLVDAGMRELWHTGFMHNRVRMIVASFLTKHCLIHWQAGMDWFWDTLVDADVANNTASWQWVAGCGADAAPYFRIFNPVLQGERFDGEGVYIKRWLPELSKLGKRFINKPWEADPMTLKLAGIVLGETYPKPIVDHREARQKALSAYQALKR